MHLHGLDVFITHGHKYKVQRTMNKLLKEAFQKEYDIVLYGHTHIPRVDKVQNVTLINPGSISKPRIDVPSTYIIMNIEKDKSFTLQYKEALTNLNFEL